MGLNGRWSELSWWTTSCPEEMSWEFEDFEKDSLEKFLLLKCAAGFLGSEKLSVSTSRDLNHHKMPRALGWGQHSVVTIGFYDFYLSLRVAKDWSQKFINSLVSETTGSIWICTIIIIEVYSQFMSIQHRELEKNMEKEVVYYDSCEKLVNSIKKTFLL